MNGSGVSGDEVPRREVDLGSWGETSYQTWLIRNIWTGMSVLVSVAGMVFAFGPSGQLAQAIYGRMLCAPRPLAVEDYAGMPPSLQQPPTEIWKSIPERLSKLPELAAAIRSLSPRPPRGRGLTLLVAKRTGRLGGSVRQRVDSPR